MRGSKAKRLRRESYVVDPQMRIVHPKHPGRKHGGLVGQSVWSRRGGQMLVPKVVAELGEAMKKATEKATYR